MKFSTKEDLEVPIDDVFAMLSDYDAFERAILRHGAEVARTDKMDRPGVGMTWHARAKLRGKLREFDARLAEYDAPNQMRFEVLSKNIEAGFLVELVALSRARTRMRIELDVRPKTLSARLLMQSAKLARNTLNRRYKTRIAHFATDLEERHKKTLRTAGA
ncbi:polyketide cyclase/dehydrase/lipid transport protein [Litoreibacter ponti]|uniref:Polyketide cyclase/dehydrase/lipid transport protein n=1 Tax=Litoreibacter ponti TaxID=1510457 RepID=A0A2T6BFM7_9RHOB|nr:SRPBCC family protein [Litoreibacter ponti]PTX54873.1 polyketide cyclase/dehydrase/lipid transport protein [Litoreibacter ponti]